MSRTLSHRGAVYVVAVLIAFALSPLLPLPARGCSCAPPPDISGWVDQSQAAFVGTLVDQRDAGNGEFGQESIYVFEVEEWVKGDVGEVIEVRSASNGAACGFEFWNPQMRIGAVIHEVGGELRGGLCSQVDPDALLTAVAPAAEPDGNTTSPTTGTTVPPLLAPDRGTSAADPTTVRWVAGLAVTGFVVLLGWLGMRRPGSSRDD